MSVTTNLPPGSNLSPQEQVKRWIENPITFWEELANQFGDEFTVTLGSLGTVVLFSNPLAIKEIFALHPDDFECHQYNKHYEYVMGAESLLLQDGLRHKRQKKLLLPPLHKEAIDNYMEIIGRCTVETIENWQQNHELIKIRPFMHEIGLKIILEIIFGSINHPLSKIIERIFITQVFQDFGSWSPWARFGKLHPKIRPLLSAEISACRQNPDRNPYSMFNLLAQAKDENGDNLSDAEIQDDIFTLLIAGVDTIALAVSWALYWIHQQPHIQEKLQAELTTLPKNFKPIEVLNLPYLHLIYQETLRMYPVVTTPIGRKLTKNKKIGNYNYPAGVTLLPCTYLVHRRKDLYLNANQFQPERFLTKEYKSYEYFPFGGGNRLCLGANLAPVEIKLILATILTKYKLELITKEEIKPIRHGTLLAPSLSLFTALLR